MRTLKFSALVLGCLGVFLISGCNPELEDLKVQNRSQRNRISELESDINTTRLKLDQAKRQLAGFDGIRAVERDALNQQIAALEEELSKKKSLVSLMQQKLLYGGGQIPVELSTLLEDFADKSNMVTFDAGKGVVKFKSDLLFEKGSDVVASAAKKAVKELCRILNNDEAKKFDIIIAGHTDDIRISRAATKAKHPTNWHLSSHRAISVLKIMLANRVAGNRLSARGFGEYRPIAANKPGKKGNPQNRRVEIYIVAKGV